MANRLLSRGASLTEALLQFGGALRTLGTEREDPFSLPRAIVRGVDAEWIAFRHAGGEWSGIGRDGPRSRFDTPEAIRRIDVGLLRRLPRGRLVRLHGRALSRSPRFAAADLLEVLVYVSAEGGSETAVVIALARPLAVDRSELEAILCAWAGSTALRSRLARVEEDSVRRETDARAACALHDLRHELTVSSLELERLSSDSPPESGEKLDRIRTAIANARALCETGLRAPDRERPRAVRIGEVLRTEASAARSVSGRGESVGITIRCDAGLEFPVEREPMSRIVRNLVLNALEHTPNGENVRIEAERGSGSHLVLRVIDRGRGMSSADQEELLRFGRSGRGGFGIGSASVASCARRIGARMRVRSKLGEGTCVELSVPQAAESP